MMRQNTQKVMTTKTARVFGLDGQEMDIEDISDRSHNEPTDKDGNFTNTIIIEEKKSKWQKFVDFLFWFLLFDAFFG